LGQSLEYHLVFELPYDIVQELNGVEHFQITQKVILQIIEKVATFGLKSKHHI